MQNRACRCAAASIGAHARRGLLLHCLPGRAANFTPSSADSRKIVDSKALEMGATAVLYVAVSVFRSNVPGALHVPFTSFPFCSQLRIRFPTELSLLEGLVCCLLMAGVPTPWTSV